MADLIQLVKVHFIVDIEAENQIIDLGYVYRKIEDVGMINFDLELDERVVESLSPDDLLGHVGIDSEFMVYVNIID